MSLKVIEKEIDQIKPYENNPRKNDEAVNDVARSLKEFGWKQPIVIDKNGTILAGHTRYKAALQLGLKSVPCVVADDLSEDQARAYRVADNKTAEESLWDMSKLDEELAKLDMTDFAWINPISNYDIEGEFDDESLDDLINPFTNDELEYSEAQADAAIESSPHVPTVDPKSLNSLQQNNSEKPNSAAAFVIDGDDSPDTASYSTYAATDAPTAYPIIVECPSCGAIFKYYPEEEK